MKKFISPRSLRFSLSIPILALVLGLAVTAAMFGGARYLEQDKTKIDFAWQANIQIDAITEGLDQTVKELTTINRLFMAIGPVSRTEFHTFTQPFTESYPYIQAISFQRLISLAERPAYEAGMRKLYPAFSITERVDGGKRAAGAKEVYRVVDYIEPLAGNEEGIGLDASSIREQAEIASRAADTGLPVASSLFQLVRDLKPRVADGYSLDSGQIAAQQGFVMMMPVYRRGIALDGPAARRGAVMGYTVILFRAKELIKGIADTNGLVNVSEIIVNVYAADHADENKLVFRLNSMPQRLLGAGRLPRWIFHDEPDNISRTVKVAGKPWHIMVSKPARFFTAHHIGSIIVLIGGVLSSILASLYMKTMVSRSQRIQQLVDARTVELCLKNEQMAKDIAARKQAEQALHLRERAIESSPNAIVITSAEGPVYPIQYVNPAFERTTGYTAGDAIGRNCNFLQGSDRDQPGIEEIREALREKREVNTLLRNYRKDGTLFWNDLYIAPVRDEAGNVIHFVAAQYDVTAKKKYEAELEFQANRDSLTGLANRNLLHDRLGQAMAYASRYQHPVWIVFMDLDRFKIVNDSLGHAAGDMLLCEAARRLQASVREMDTVARMGGDKFVLVLPERTDERLTTGVIQRLMDVIAQPFAIGEHQFFLTCSLGVAVYPNDGTESEVLIKHADITMYRAKEKGRNNFQFYTSSMTERALERLRIEQGLRNAIERDEFTLHYQPQVELRTGSVIGMEALIRWRHPELGMVPPGRFIELAEETGLIVPIGTWVLRTACAQNKAWQDAGLGYLRIAVNLSARQFAQKDIVRTIESALAESGLAPHYLEVELTESLLMTDVERGVDVLKQLKSLGVHLSIDDFGTGYSSLSYLKRFPLDVLKIDQSFVRDLADDPDDAAIVLSIISLAHSLRLNVIAEGVETEEQLAYLCANGCDEIQGYYFSRPVASDAFAQILREKKNLYAAGERMLG